MMSKEPQALCPPPLPPPHPPLGSLPCAFPIPPRLVGWGREWRRCVEAGLFVFLLSQEVVQMSQG